MTTTEILPILQLSVSPVILISAVGMLLLTMNNRIAYSLGRARQLLHDAEKATDADMHASLDAEVEVIFRRAHLQRSAITYASTSALFAAILIISLFLSALFGIDIAWLYTSSFIVALSSLIVSLSYFIREVRDSLDAFNLNLLEHEERFHKS